MFTAHCARGHDRIDFDGDREAFQAHMVREHRARTLQAGGAHYTTDDRRAPGWHDGRIQAPHAWKAPRATPGGIARVARDLEAGKYDLALTYTGPVVRPGEAVA